MPTEVAAEQLVLAWSPSNLLGVSGMGPVAGSPGWELPPRDSFAGLGAAARYLSDDVPLPAGTVPPVSLEYRPDPSGALLVAKTYSIASRRPGQYQVHAIRADQGLSPWDLWALADTAVLLVDGLAEHPADLAAPSLTPVRRPRVQRDPDDVAELARLLQCLNEDQPYLVGAHDQDQGVDAIQTLLAYLPIGLARDVPVSTFVGSAPTWTSGIGLLVRPFSTNGAALDLDLDPDHPASAPASGAYLPLADQLVNGGSGLPALRIRSLGDLKALLALERADLASVDLPTLARALGTPFFDAVLAKLAAHARCDEVLRRMLADGDTEEVPAARVRRDGAGHADLVAARGRVLGETGASGGRGPLQSWVLQAVGAEAFVNYVVPPLIAEAREGGVQVHAADLASLLGRSVEVDDLRRGFVFEASPDRWGRVAEAEFEASLRGDHRLSAGTRELLRTQPAKAAAFLDGRLTSKALPQTALAWALERWTVADLPDLVRVLVGTKAMPHDWVVKALGARPEPVAREILATQWPAIAAQLGVPASLAELLAVPKKPWWGGR